MVLSRNGPQKISTFIFFGQSNVHEKNLVTLFYFRKCFWSISVNSTKSLWQQCLKKANNFLRYGLAPGYFKLKNCIVLGSIIRGLN